MALTRREAALALLAGTASRGESAADVRQATGVKVGEITPRSAVVWTRRTMRAWRLHDGIPRRGHSPRAFAPKSGEDINRFEGACPGEAGYVRLALEPVSGRGGKRVEGWVELADESDFVHQFRLDGLQPATRYRFAVSTRAARSRREEGMLTGEFATAPLEQSRQPVRLALISCQMYCRMDRADGFWIYPSLERLRPDFFVSCGDNVYYDSEDPVVNAVPVARYHWHRMYSLATLHACLRTVPGYWQKDDHDLFSDDCWPGIKTPKMEPFQFTEGQRIFREQVPSPPLASPMYRSFRWGAELEIWLPDSRDYRSPNPDDDSATKSIWGPQQKQWLQKTLAQSTARWKIVINPNPVIGPDHVRKRDNHANPAFATEGREFRKWLKANVYGSVILMNGDRHWQYHSVDPETGLHEFGCGPASDEHAVPPSGGEDKRFHRFLRIKGGFITAQVDPGRKERSLLIEHRDVRGDVVYRAIL